MFNEKNYNTIKIVVAATYLFMIIMNGLANSVPINGVTTGEVSDSYPDLFAPASITFAIWGIIYLLLAAYTLYQFGFFRQNRGISRAELFSTIGIYFSISSIANGLWILAWHYDAIGLSLLLMLVVLINLIMIGNRLSREEFSLQEKLLIRLPFSIYFGWITVATIANVTTYLVSIGWGGFGISEQIWTIFVLFAGVVIAGARMIRDRDVAYGLVIVWAYIGIWVKHASASEFAGQYPAVISAVTVCILLLLVAEAYLLYPRFRKNTMINIQS
ncbi:MAG: tryptophan-rich sensory protein [Bacillota bacterium]